MTCLLQGQQPADRLPAARAGLVPGLIYLHTGGFMMASIDDIDSPARMIADLTGGPTRASLQHP